MGPESGACVKGRCESLATYDVKADELAVAYGRSTCRAVCEAMQVQLPRELPDMVYEKLLPHEKRVWHFDDDPLALDEFPLYLLKGVEDFLLPHLCSVEYLGVDFTTELA
jgi:hypothetical protein